MPVDADPDRGGQGDETTSHRQLIRRFVVFMLVAGMVGVTGNLAVQRHTMPSNRGVRSHESDALSHLFAEEGKTLRIRYLFATVLRDHLEGGTLVVPPEIEVDDFRVGSLGDVDVKVESYPFEVDAATAGELHGRGIAGEGSLSLEGEERPFVVVPGEPGDRYRLLVNGETVFVVPETMVERGGP